MNLKALFFTVALCTLSYAWGDAPQETLDLTHDMPVFEDLPIVDSVIERETVPVAVKAKVTSKVQEKSVYAVTETRVGFAKIVRSGVTVQLGTTATMSYHMRFRGISSAKLAKMDQRFVETLSLTEKRKYYNKKKSFDGGLGVVFLKFLGIRLDGKTNKASQAKAAARTKQYARKAAAAKAILAELSKSAVVVSGHLTAIGVSFRPTTAFAFIEVARVKLKTGQIVTVVSSNKSALQVRTADGKGVGTSNKQVKVEDDDDYYFEPKKKY